jgi:hypothetical protein
MNRKSPNMNWNFYIFLFHETRMVIKVQKVTYDWFEKTDLMIKVFWNPFVWCYFYLCHLLSNFNFPFSTIFVIVYSITHSCKLFCSLSDCILWIVESAMFSIRDHKFTYCLFSILIVFESMQFKFSISFVIWSQFKT